MHSSPYSRTSEAGEVALEEVEEEVVVGGQEAVQR
jgi:hypothetical protein